MSAYIKNKVSFSKQADCNLTTRFSGPKSSRDFRGTGPRSLLFVTRTYLDFEFLCAGVKSVVKAEINTVSNSLLFLSQLVCVSRSSLFNQRAIDIRTDSCLCSSCNFIHSMAHCVRSVFNTSNTVRLFLRTR